MSVCLRCGAGLCLDLENPGRACGCTLSPVSTKPKRPDRDTYFLAMAQLVASRATCARRSVGCVLVSARGHVLATGYNGVAAGVPHCNEGRPCPAAGALSGTQLDGCEAIHAEQNALLQCRDVYEAETCYVTVSPCVTCVKLLLNTGVSRVVFTAPYSHDGPARHLWLSAIARQPRRTWEACGRKE